MEAPLILSLPLWAPMLPLVALGYLSGSWLGALTVCRLAGVGDPRLDGSFNPGFSNVLRLHGRRLALATLLVDAAKGMPVLLLAILLGMPPWAQGGMPSRIASSSTGMPLAASTSRVASARRRPWRRSTLENPGLKEPSRRGSPTPASRQTVRAPSQLPLR